MEIISLPAAGSKPPRRERRFSDMGTLEIGASFLFAYDRQNLQELEGHFERYSVQAGLYVGYYVMRMFVLGIHVGIPYRETRYQSEDRYSGYTVRDFGLSVIFAPGVGGRISDGVAFYAEALIGFGHLSSRSLDTDGAEFRTSTNAGIVGGEIGVRILLTKHLLMRLGLRPVYWFGATTINDDVRDQSESDSDGVRVELVLGFSYYQ